MLAHPAHVGGGGLAQPFGPFVGEDDVGAAPVGRALPAPDIAAAHHRVDAPRRAARREVERAGEVLHPQALLALLGHHHQHLVLGEGQPVLGLELLIERREQPGGGVEQRPPGVHLALRQPVHRVDRVGPAIRHARIVRPSAGYLRSQASVL